MCVVVQIANSNPLVSDRQDLSVLQSEYAEDDTVYQLKIKVSQSAAPLRLLQPHVNPKFLCLNSQKLFWIWCYRFFLKLLLLQDLHKKYSYIRKTRPDGNCFYRAFGFAHLESLLDDSKELQR